MERDALKRLRDELDMTQEALAEQIGAAVSTVARWERGEAIPRSRNRRRYAEALDLTVDELDAILDADTPPAADIARYRQRGEARHDTGAEEVNRREFVAAMAATAAAGAGSVARPPRPRVGVADVARLRAEVHDLHALDDQYGGAIVYRQALARADHVRELLDRSTYSPTVGRDLQVVAGQLTELSGWLAFDAGHHERARQLWTEALYVARVAENDRLTVAVMTSMCLQTLHLGHSREALDLAGAAQRIARPFATPRLLSMLAAREARARSLMRDGAGCHSTLLRSEQLLDEGPSADDEDWLAFWGPADFYCAVAAAQMALGAPAEAERASRAAVAASEPTYPRNQALYQADLAESLAAQHRFDEAATLASAALSRVPDVSSGRLRDDLVSLGSRLEPHRSEHAVQQYLDDLAQAGVP
jgi:transcriptional regulator with XRE-family HTH domain